MQKSKSKIVMVYLTIILSACFSSHLQAAEIIAEVTKKYRIQNDMAPSIGELLSHYNSVKQQLYDQCRSAETYTCWTSAPFSQGGAADNSITVNGEPQSYTAIGTSIREKKDIAGITHYPPTVAKGIIDTFYHCPDNFGLRWKAVGNNKENMVCVYIEPESCAEDGNPINIATGKKIERETDFATADNVLRIERLYLGQSADWSFAADNFISHIPPGGKTKAPQEYPNYQKFGRVALINGVQAFEYYWKNIPIYYANDLTEEIVYLNIKGKRYRYVKKSGIYKGDGPIGEKTQLSQVNPQTEQGAEWKYVTSNGDASYFSGDGYLLRTHLSQGGMLSYEYVGSKLKKTTDHFGRSLTYYYDTNSRLIAVSQPDGQFINYEYGMDASKPDFYSLKKVIWPTGESVTYNYDTANPTNTNVSLVNPLTAKLNSEGNTIGSYGYTGLVATSTQSGLGTFKRVMKNYGSYTTVTDGLNSTRTYYFNKTLSDGTKLITNTNQPAGSGCAAATQSATYYTDGLKKSETNFNGHKTQFAYDATRALETVKVEGVPTGNNTDYLSANTTLVAGARKITTQWHSQHRKPIKKFEPKLITTFIYNGDADPFNNNAIANCTPLALPLLCHKIQQATTDANGAAGVNATLDNTLASRHEFYTYNNKGQQLTFSRTAADSPEETREYYEATGTDWMLGDLKKITNALGHETEFTRYDRNGRLLEMYDANGVKTEFTYDARGRILTQSINDKVTTYTYDLNGNRNGSVLPNDVAITYHYDLAKRLTEIESSLGDKIIYEYDVESNVRYQRIKNATGDITYVKENVYDALSRLKNTLNTSSQGSTYLYDARGNLTGEVDANTYSTAFTFDALNRLKIITNPLNGKTEHGYDAQGNLTSVKDPKGNSTIYSYNAFGDLIGQISPDTGTTTHSYDALGNRTQSIDARGVTVVYGYDDLNRLTSVEYAAMPSENVTYVYDNTANNNYGIGRLTSIIRNDIHLDYVYNAEGLIFKKYTQVSNTFSSTEYHYDDAGNLTSVIYPSGRVINYHLDDLARISSITTKANAAAAEQTIVENAGYLPFGPANTYTYGNDLNHTQLYDQNYRLTDIQVGGLLNRTYGYDPVNNITSINDGLNSAKSQIIG